MSNIDVHILDKMRDITADVCAIKDHLHTEQPTWLDRCAWAAMQGLLAANSGVGVMHMAKLTEGDAGEPIAKAAYNIAAAMLAEKRKREGAL